MLFMVHAVVIKIKLSSIKHKLFLKSIKTGENEFILLLSPEHVAIAKYSGVMQTLLPSVR